LAYLKKTLTAESAAAKSQLLKTLKKAVESGELTQDKSSYRIPGEVFEAPPDETVQVALSALPGFDLA
jgi:hypothetical protein